MNRFQELMHKNLLPQISNDSVVKIRRIEEGEPDSSEEKLNPSWISFTKVDIALISSMILGILAKEIWNNVQDGNSMLIHIPSVIGALVVSPIIYLGTYGSMTQHTQVTPVSLSIAFQAGFFWQTIFDGVAESGIGQPVELTE